MEEIGRPRLDQPRDLPPLERAAPSSSPILRSAVVIPAPTAAPSHSSANFLPDDDEAGTSDDEWEDELADVRYDSIQAAGVKVEKDYSARGELDRTLRKAKLPALFKQLESFEDFVEPREGVKIPSPLPGDANDVDDPAEAMEMEDPFEREEGASAPIPPPPRNVILSDPLDAGGFTDDRDSADAANAHAADTADTAAPISPGLSDLVDEDLLLLSDDDPEQRTEGK